METMTTMQTRVGRWVRTRFGEAVLRDRRERAMRVLEEALELAQAEGLGPNDAKMISQRVFERPPGDPEQEGAGVAVTLLAWAEGRGIPLTSLIRGEVSRVYSLPPAHFRDRQNAKADAGVAMGVDPSPRVL